MPRVSLHGTTLSWSSAGLAVDPLAALLEMLDPQPSAPADAAAIHFDLCPATPRAAADPLEEGFVPSFFHGAVQGFRGPSGFLLWDRSSRVLIPDGGSSARGELCAPGRELYAGSSELLLQIAVTLALRRAGLFHVHAAALAHPAGATVVVAGGSGAGKTTTSLALLEAGFDYLGDDALFLAPTGAPFLAPAGAPFLSAGNEREPAAVAVAFPRAFHVGPATLAAFPRLAPFAGAAPQRSDKRPLDPRQAFPGRYRPALPLRAGATLVIFPSIGGGPTTTLAEVTKADAFGCLLAASATLILDGIPRRDDNLALLRALCSAAACFELCLGRDALAAPTDAIAARLSAACRRAGVAA